jgi:hypothetical protein
MMSSGTENTPRKIPNYRQTQESLAISEMPFGI